MAYTLPLPIEIISIIGLAITAVALLLVAHARGKFFPSPFRRLISVMIGILVLSLLTHATRAIAVNTNTFSAYAFAAELNVMATLLVSLFFIAAAFLVFRLSEMYGFGGKQSARSQPNGQRLRKKR